MKEITITNDNFEKEVLSSPVPVLVDFWASWCGPCKMLAPIIEEIADEFDGKIKVGKVNVDEEEMLARVFQIRSIPTLILFEGGKAARMSLGYMPKEDVVKFINGENLDEGDGE